jgi:hypothetical protein
MSPSPSVRRFRLDDVPALIALFRDAVRRVNGSDYLPPAGRVAAATTVIMDRAAAALMGVGVTSALGGA